MEPLPEPNSPSWPFPFTVQDWQQAPPTVQTYLHTLRDEMDQLQERVEHLEAQLHQHSTTLSRPPSSDSPFQKPHRRTGAKSTRKGGGTPGHPEHRQVLLTTTTIEDVLPESCACGSSAFALLRPSYTHQVIELSPIAMEVKHWVLHEGRCMACGCWQKAQVLARLSANTPLETAQL